jgi:hypothetical protein
MWVVYCKGCLPTKMVVAWTDTESTAKICFHMDHADSPNAYFNMTDEEWASVEVKNADGTVDITQTSTNIVNNFGGRFV